MQVPHRSTATDERRNKHDDDTGHISNVAHAGVVGQYRTNAPKGGFTQLRQRRPDGSPRESLPDVHDLRYPPPLAEKARNGLSSSGFGSIYVVVGSNHAKFL